MAALNQGLHNGTLKLLENSKWKLALEYTNIGVWEFDADINKVFFSTESKKMIGFENDPEFGSNMHDWNNRVHPDDQEKYYQDFQNHLSGKVPMYENQHRIKCKDGNYKWILDRGKIISRYNNGKPKIVIGTHTEITNSKIAEENTITALNLATEQNNKLRNFAHIVTHNLKQHAGNFESLLSFYQEAETENEKKELISHLEIVSESLTKTITNLKQIVTVQANKNRKTEKIYLAKEVNAVLKSLDFVIAENNAVVNNNINPKLFLFYNISYFESVIQNLLTNALKYKHPEEIQ